jgi:hypothetical protein
MAMNKKTPVQRASEQIAAILEEHFAELPPGERKARTQAFHQASMKVGSGAKGAALRGTAESRQPAQRHG